MMAGTPNADHKGGTDLTLSQCTVSQPSLPITNFNPTGGKEILLPYCIWCIVACMCYILCLLSRLTPATDSRWSFLIDLSWGCAYLLCLGCWNLNEVRRYHNFLKIGRKNMGLMNIYRSQRWHLSLFITACHNHTRRPYDVTTCQ